MARRSHDDYSNSSEDRSRDLTAQFWGSSPEWRTTGSVRRVRRNGDRTGPVARTRKHGDRTGQIPMVAAVPVEEPLIDPYDFGFDDVGYGPDPGAAGRRLDNWNRTSVDPATDEPHDAVELIELEERRTGRLGDPVSTLAERLGLGAVDPLLRRLGVIVMIGVLSVPLAMSLRPDPSSGSVQTDVTAMQPTEQIATGEAPAVEDVPQTLVVDSGDSTDSPSSAQSSDETAAPSASPTTVETATSQTEPTATTVSMGDATESADEPGPEVAETAEAIPAGQDVSEAADADEPANRVAPVCHLSYTVGPGDYWIRIADAADTTLAKLLQANLATVLTPLYPGDDICLPEGATLPAPPTATTTTPPATTAPTTTASPTTTTAPTTSGPVVTAPPAPAAIEAIIREIWPDDLEDRALEIAWRESGYRSNAQNWCCYGLFQIHWNVHRSWLDDIGVTSAAQLLDAGTNARAAYALYQRSGGWGPWGG